ncbi:MAG: multicopper oxidase family protein [Ktedonobacteraceae bacterium]|nr:multicopper oxidase family protein [Ktedonobacteraceae bacterium]
MHSTPKTRFAIGITLISASFLATLIISACMQQPTKQSTHAVPGHVRNFTLYVRDNQIKMPDGKQIYSFGYTDDPRGRSRLPGPTIEVDEGDTVNITLVNDKDPTSGNPPSGGDGHTIHLHGLDLPSQFDGDPMTAPGGSVKQGKSFTYHFVANHPGTYWYHCHEEAPEHIQMGMYGPLIVHPRGDHHHAYPNTTAYDKEYTFLLSDIDSQEHDDDYNTLFKGSPETNWTQYHPNYFLINGKAWPDTMMDPTTSITATVGQKVLVRLINAGNIMRAMHSHGFHFQVIGTDGRKLDSPYFKDTLAIAPGERYDILLDLNQVGRYMFHDHVEYATTNNGVAVGGIVTMINVNKPDGSNPVPMPPINNTPED